MSKEQELLKKLAAIWDEDLVLSAEEGAEFERELAKLYMPQLDDSVTDSELFEWGAKFKAVVKERLKLFRQGKIG